MSRDSVLTPWRLVSRRWSKSLACDAKMKELVDALEARDRNVNIKISRVTDKLNKARCRCGEDKENPPPSLSSGGVSLGLILLHTVQQFFPMGHGPYNVTNSHGSWAMQPLYNP